MSKRLMLLTLFAFMLAGITANAAEPLFQTRTHWYVEKSPYGMVIADFNGDGINDMATTSYETDSASVLIGAGDGNFEPAVFYTTSTSCDGLLSADIDTDGDIDLLAFSYMNVSVLKNDGSGVFGAPESIPMASVFLTLGLADLDHDDDIDIVLPSSDWQNDTLYIYLNNGDGTFADGNKYQVNTYLNDVYLADINEDSHVDICIAANDGEIITMFNDGAADFTMNTYNVGASPDYISTADYDGDSDVDIMFADASTDRAIIMANDGSSAFAVVDSFDLDIYFDDFMTADLDRDGDHDVVIVGDSMGVYTNDGAGNFALTYASFTGYESFSVNVGLLDGDGYPDIAISTGSYSYDSEPCYIAVFINDRAGSFLTRETFGDFVNNQGICSGDFDDDGDMDIAMVSYWSDWPTSTGDTLVIYENDGGTGNFVRSGAYVTRTKGWSVHAEDLNGDNIPDITVGYSEGTMMSVFLNNGSGTFGARADYTAGEKPINMAFGNLDGDTDMDIVVSNRTSGTFTLLLNNGSGVFTGGGDFGSASSPYDIVCADIVNNDGNIDVVFPDYNNARLVLYHGDGAGNFPNSDFIECPGYYPYAVTAADFDNDGDIDVAATDEYTHKLLIFENFNHLNLQAPDVYMCGVDAYDIITADFNDDGLTDIATANSSSYDVSVFMNEGSLDFSGAHGFGAYYEPTALCAEDFDGDGNIDIACTDYSYGTFSVLLNRFDVVVNVDDPDDDILPDRFLLKQNYPNPFNASTAIEYAVPAKSQVTVTVYNILGREVNTLVDENKAAGNYRVVWDGSDYSGKTVASGIYLYQVRIGDKTGVKKAVLLK